VKQNSFKADRKLMRALEKRSQPVSCDEGHILFSQGDAPRGLYMLRSGEASLIMQSPSGNIVFSLPAPAGSLLGLPAVIGNESYSLSAMVRKDSDVRFVSRIGFKELLQAEPSLYPSVLQVLAAELRAFRLAFSEIQSQVGECTTESRLPATDTYSEMVPAA
jgi:CRP-like cAMP-binding protein